MISGFLLAVIGFALMIGPLVFLHELGHYLVARWCGVKAEVFSVGFGREVAGFTDSRGTRWKLAWLPMGGYVKFAGDMNPASLSDPAWLSLPPAERARTFPAKPLWQRALIVLGGPMANFVVAAVLFAGLALWLGDDRSFVGAVLADSPAAAAQIATGDRIVALDDQRVSSFQDLVAYVGPRAGETVVVHIDRDGTPVDREVKLGTREMVSTTGEHYTLGQLGVGTAPMPLWRAPVVGVERVFSVTGSIVSGLGQIIGGERSMKELGGPLRIAQVSAQGLEAGWISFLAIAALISVNLGFINLLPVPMLDGGHLLFYAIEAVQRRPVSQRTMEWAFGGGLIAVLTLAMVVTFNDLGAFGLWRGLAGLIG